MERAGAARDAEVVVLNTCTVTGGADKDARASIRRLQRENPGCRILVTGCYAQRAPEELARMPGVTWVVGNSHKHQAAEIVAGVFPPFRKERERVGQPASVGFVSLAQLSRDVAGFPHNRKERDCVGHPTDGVGHAEIVVGDIFAHTELLAAPVFEAANARTRPNLKVQDGCDNRCSFCVIPYVRGQSRSLPLERAIGEVRALVEAGYREVVISGINLGRWGRDLENSGQPSAGSYQLEPLGGRLVDLVRAILKRTSLAKLRISSVEPMDWSDELIGLVAESPRIAKHAHVPMQSGSDAVLRRMHRKYRPWHYREKILKIHRAMPRAAIGADVMVGFPGETDAEFAETRRMVEELPFTYLHVFTYSARPGTPAAEQSGQVPVTLARERNRELREIAGAKKRAFAQSLVGSTAEAITLHARGRNFTEALTDNYLKMRVSGKLEANRWWRVQVEGSEGETLLGRNTSFIGVGGPPAGVSALHGQPEVTRKYSELGSGH